MPIPKKLHEDELARIGRVLNGTAEDVNSVLRELMHGVSFNHVIRGPKRKEGEWGLTRSNLLPETHIVQRGTIAVAVLPLNPQWLGTDPNIVLYHEGDIFTTLPNEAFRFYLYKGAVVCSVGHIYTLVPSNKVQELDSLTKHITNEDIEADTAEESFFDD
jgi:hypothetical protein